MDRLFKIRIYTKGGNIISTICPLGGHYHVLSPMGVFVLGGIYYIDSPLRKLLCQKIRVIVIDIIISKICACTCMQRITIHNSVHEHS